MHRFFRRNLPTEARIRAWVGEHPLMRRLLARAGFFGLDRRTLARGVSVGLLVGLTPTVGFQTPLLILLCVLLRASFPAAFLVSWVSNPLTAAPLYFAFNRTGEAVFGEWLGLSPSGAAGHAATQTLYLGLGSLLIALPAALAGYFLFLGAWRLSVLYKWRSRSSRGA
ncbi:DUF2062 domain-containing protein [Thiohalorhabdus denitrificans]|uniref:DUF2062 domain-containing protein n=1 Tax=Thiohalorhabdus denitrificans TaxID=381306 RepID=A0A1G5AEM0_9GAMM|nr:DUF2062 domain-containing protein [Thiohalorhabdus denitrificans]SCX76305.1 hypothetical protein SAMN05661077_0301 [Thiohalorhabdus denitrificans]